MKEIKHVGKEAIQNRVNKMVEMRTNYIKNGVENIHVKLQKGNSKTGNNCYTVSLIPIADCGKNCHSCSKDCYDVRNVCWQPKVQNDRARNSAIHLLDPERFWEEVSMNIKLNCVYELRINVGGDLKGKDFPLINKVAKENPKCKILFFTKAYEEINKFLDKNEFEENVHAIMSAWKNTTMDNRHNLPVSHVLWPDGETTAPEYGSYFCKGNCSMCNFNGEGCWTLKKGESVIFVAH